MYLTIEDHGHAHVLRPTKARLDAAVSTEFRNQAREALAKGGDVWIVDLAPVSFIDSSGIGTLVGLLKLCGRDRRFELCGMAPTLQHVFKLTRMEMIFRIHANVAAALGAHDPAHRLTAS
ncbi:MAG: STAS domain-containing protein [Pseudomonadota bacterium]